MIYIVQVFCKGVLVLSREVHGIAQVERIQAVYADVPGYEVDFNPDTFRYMRLNHNFALS